MPSPRSFTILFIVGSTSSLLILPECLNDSCWCFSSSFSAFEDRRRFFSQSCSFLFKIHGSSFMPSSQIISGHENSFHTHPKHFTSSFHFIPTKAIISGLFVLSFHLSLSKSYRCIVQITSNQFMASSFSYI